MIIGHVNILCATRIKVNKHDFKRKIKKTKKAAR